MQRIILRAVSDARTAGSREASGANVLAALFSERESQARQGELDTLYRVVLLNDERTPMEFVVQVLERIFGKSWDEVARVIHQVRDDGVGNCGVYPHEIAETKVSQVADFARQNRHPLQCTIEKD